MPPKPFVTINPCVPGFTNCLKKLSPEAYELARQAMHDLLLPEIPSKYNFKRGDGNSHEITFGKNREYKMTMGIQENGVAWLRRVGSHREIDEA